MHWLLAFAFVSMAGASVRAEEIVLFNGKDLTGWVGTHERRRPDDTRKIEDIWTVKNGEMVCTGGLDTWAGMHTQRQFTNFSLHLEFRWLPITPEVEKSEANIYNSGLFLRSIARPDGSATLQPISYQVQIVHTPKRPQDDQGPGSGDLWIVGYDHPAFAGERPAASLALLGGRVGARAVQSAPAAKSTSRGYPRSKFAEKPVGEWNAYDITFIGDKVTVKLNGEQVNSGTGAGVVPGRIGMECENTPIAFRNIKITPRN